MSEEVVTLQDMKDILEKFYSNDGNTIRYAHNRASIGTTDPTVVLGMVFNVMRLFAGSVYDAGSFDLLFADANRLTSKSVRDDFGGAVANATTIPIGKQWKNYMRTYLETIINDQHWNSPIYHELMEQYDQAANGFQMRRALYDIFSEVVRIREQGSQPVPPQPTIRTVTLSAPAGSLWTGPSTIADGSTLTGTIYPPTNKVITQIVISGGASATYSDLSAASYTINNVTVNGANVVITVTVGTSPTPARTATVKFLENGVSTTRTPDVDFGADLIPETDVKYIKIEYDSDGQSPGTPEAYYCKSMEIVRTNSRWEHRSYIGVDSESYTLSGANMNVTFGYSGGATVRVTPGQLVGGNTANFNLRSYFNMTISDTIPS